MTLIDWWAQFDAGMFWLVSEAVNLGWLASGAGPMISIFLGQALK
jgi:hypothetical protein